MLFAASVESIGIIFWEICMCIQSRYRLRDILFSAIAFVALSESAYAADCKSLQKGTEVFADTFADDTGGWAGGDGSAFGKPALTLTLYTPYVNWNFVNNTFNESDGDFCTQAVLPTAPAADNLAYIGLITLYKDNDNLTLLQISSKDDIELYRKVSGTWTTVATLTNPGVKPAPGSVVTLRTTVKGTLVDVSINGVELKKIRMQVPTGALKFGLYVQTDKGVPKPGLDFQFNNYRVTSGE
jgi:hypothetical protein